MKYKSEPEHKYVMIIIMTIYVLAGYVAVAFILAYALTGCTRVEWKGADGSELNGYSVLSNKHLSGSLKTDGNKRTLVIKELDENQTDGITQIVGAAVKAAVEGAK